jgi:hypothetical protein
MKAAENVMEHEYFTTEQDINLSYSPHKNLTVLRYTNYYGTLLRRNSLKEKDMQKKDLRHSEGPKLMRNT